MNPFDMGMDQIQTFAGLAEQSALLTKRVSAMELSQAESAIAIAAARAKVADAELAKLQVQLAAAREDATEAAHLNALIAAVTAERDARAAEVECLTGDLEIRREMAQVALAIDPSAMSQVLELISGPDSDDSDDDPETAAR